MVAMDKEEINGDYIVNDAASWSISQHRHFK